jgi:hypothetical protein
MSVRKLKPSSPSPIDLPEKRLQLVTVSVKPKSAPVYQRTSHTEQQDLTDQVPPAGKPRLH